MFGLIIVIHLIVCILLITIILIQRGHGGGLVESFSGVESMFGTKTNTFLARFTTIISSLFLITCLMLAVFSAKQSRSLMKNTKPIKTQAPVETKAQPETEVSPQPASESKPQPEVQSQSQTQPQQQEANKTE